MNVDRNNKGQFYKGMVGAHRSHGLTKTHIYRIYNNLNDRCTRVTNHKFPRYGGRGIKNLWSNFQSFHDDMFPSYREHVEKHGEKNTTIDRIDNNGNYCKENCRWATWKEQARNTSQNRIITYKGKTQTLIEWSEETGVASGKIINRLKRGWTLEKIFTRKGLELIAFKGKEMPLVEWAKELGINYGTLWDRVVKEKWPLERAFTNKDFRI